MSKELEKAGLPVAIISAMYPVVEQVRANRIVAGVRIPHPVSNPTVAPDKEMEVRTAMAKRALAVLTLPVDGPTVFAVEHPGAR